MSGNTSAAANGATVDLEILRRAYSSWITTTRIRKAVLEYLKGQSQEAMEGNSAVQEMQNAIIERLLQDCSFSDILEHGFKIGIISRLDEEGRKRLGKRGRFPPANVLRLGVTLAEMLLDRPETMRLLDEILGPVQPYK